MKRTKLKSVILTLAFTVALFAGTNQTFAKAGDLTLGRGEILGATLESVNYDIKDNSTYG